MRSQYDVPKQEVINPVLNKVEEIPTTPTINKVDEVNPIEPKPPIQKNDLVES
jgi:hypothetical protein